MSVYFSVSMDTVSHSMMVVRIIKIKTLHCDNRYLDLSVIRIS